MNNGAENDEQIQLLPEKETNWIKLLYLQLLMSSPILWVILFFWQLHSPIECQLAFQLITLSGIPFIYLWITKQPLKSLIVIINVWKELLQGIVLLLISLIGTGITCFIICEYTNVINFEQINGLRTNINSMIIACILLGISNPFLEEFFWRSYCPHVIGISNELIKWYISLNYGAYHFFVLYVLVNKIYLAFIGFIVISIGGRVFFLTKYYLGILPTALFHMGADLAVILVVAYYNEY